MAEKIQVWRENDRVLIRTGYSADFDLVVELYHNTNENAWLITPEMPVTDFNKGRLIHCGPDDFAASFVGEYGILSGNHASAFAVRVLIFDHGMSEKDLGTIFTDENGNKFCLMEIWDEDNLLIHPLPSGKAPTPGFTAFHGEKLFLKERLIPVIVSSPVQLYPSNRISKKAFLVDGKTPLPEKELVECTFLDYVFNYDVVLPEALVNMVADAPGKVHFPRFTPRRTMVDLAEHADDPAYDTYRSLPALLSYKVTSRHEAGGACVIYREATARNPMTGLEALDVMFIWDGEFAGMPVNEFYIPGVKPFTLTAKNGQQYEADFANVARFDKKFPADCMMTQESVCDKKCQPDRFIRLAGTEDERLLGFAAGYSLCNGISAMPEWADIRQNIYQFAPSWKMYPRIYKMGNIPAKWNAKTVCFRCYFDPAAEPDLTAYYYFHEGDDLIVHIDCHRTLSGKIIRLPKECAACTMTILRMTGSLNAFFDAGKNQLVINAEGDGGSASLRFSPLK